jgi:outer membrane protein OmpA-like peptidoglycan-associated protein
MTKARNQIALVAVFALATSGAGVVMADSEYDTTVIRGKVPTQQEVINALKPDAAADAGDELSTRGLKVKKSAAAKPKAIDLQINFEFGSYDLTPSAQTTLGSLAGALTSPELEPFGFLIEGHTDSVGSAAYNKRLSEQRASAVKQFLVSQHRVDAGRLRTVGRGEEALLRPEQPTSGENRRVQIVTQQ